MSLGEGVADFDEPPQPHGGSGIVTWSVSCLRALVAMDAHLVAISSQRRDVFSSTSGALLDDLSCDTIHRLAVQVISAFGWSRDCIEPSAAVYVGG